MKCKEATIPKIEIDDEEMNMIEMNAKSIRDKHMVSEIV